MLLESGPIALDATRVFRAYLTLCAFRMHPLASFEIFSSQGRPCRKRWDCSVRGYLDLAGAWNVCRMCRRFGKGEMEKQDWG